MGYRKKPNHVHLTFNGDPELEGLEVTLRGQTLEEFLDLVGLNEVSDGELTRQITKFTESLIAWNLEEEDGTPVPATAEAARQQDQKLMIRLATEWIDTLNGKVDAPLEPPSPNGQPSPEASIPMESPSSLPPPTAVPA